MRYYYLQADNTPGGPEPLESLVSMTASGQITLTTLVVPEGGEDWTPLARVVSFYYADAQGQSAGPVPFSELSRMQQVQALTVESWVLPAGATQWISLKDVLTSGGAVIAETVTPARSLVGSPAQLARGAASTVRASGAQVGESNNKSHVRTVVVRRPSTGGLGRLQYFLLTLALFVVVLPALLICILAASRGASMAGIVDKLGSVVLLPFEFFLVGMSGYGWILFLFMRHAEIAILILGPVVILFLSYQRNKNIGLPVFLPLLLLLPLALGILLYYQILNFKAFRYSALPLNILNLVYWGVLFAFPPRFARTRKMDNAGYIAIGVYLALIAAAYFYLEHHQPKYGGGRSAGIEDFEPEKKPAAPATLDETRKAAEEAARRNPAGSNP